MNKNQDLGTGGVEARLWRPLERLPAKQSDVSPRPARPEGRGQAARPHNPDGSDHRHATGREGRHGSGVSQRTPGHRVGKTVGELYSPGGKSPRGLGQRRREGR